LLEGFPQRCNERLPEDASHGCGMSLLAKRFFEWTERRASEAPAGLPQARRRSAEKTGAGFLVPIEEIFNNWKNNCVEEILFFL
jgi:hypothetical protein